MDYAAIIQIITIGAAVILVLVALTNVISQAFNIFKHYICDLNNLLPIS